MCITKPAPPLSAQTQCKVEQGLGVDGTQVYHLGRELTTCLNQVGRLYRHRLTLGIKADELERALYPSILPDLRKPVGGPVTQKNLLDLPGG